MNNWSWLDDLNKRWAIYLVIISIVTWAASVQNKIAAHDVQLTEISDNLKALSAIQAEWPYLKEKISSIELHTRQLVENKKHKEN